MKSQLTAALWLLLSAVLCVCNGDHWWPNRATASRRFMNRLRGGFEDSEESFVEANKQITAAVLEEMRQMDRSSCGIPMV